MIKLQFYKDNILVGTCECNEMSSHEDRVEAAKNNNIGPYDTMVLDDGRMMITTKELTVGSYTAIDDSKWLFVKRER